MRFFLDTEYDGHNGPLISMALIREDRNKDIYIVTAHTATDPWVKENVVPKLKDHKAKNMVLTSINGAGVFIKDFLLFEDDIEIHCDSVTDLMHFGRAYSTSALGEYSPNTKPQLRFVVHNIESYPTALEDAVKHNSWWDALALLDKIMLSDEEWEKWQQADMDRMIDSLSRI